MVGLVSISIMELPVRRVAIQNPWVSEGTIMVSEQRERKWTFQRDVPKRYKGRTE